MQEENARSAVLAPSSPSDEFSGYDVPVVGYDWSKGNDLERILESYKSTGFQATSFGFAVDEINKMIDARNSKVWDDTSLGEVPGCTIFLGYTSNLVSSGLRETIRFLTQHNLIDCIVTTAGGIEEDFIKCLSSTFLGDFSLNGKRLRDNGINRIGNLLIPNDNYCKFENWVTPILDEMLDMQMTTGDVWTPSKMIAKLGEKIDNKNSICYWAWKNKIPVYSPALTDGSLGDMMFFHSVRNPGLILDIVGDLRDLNLKAMNAKQTGMVILGGGLIKHHICNANLMVNINMSFVYDFSFPSARIMNFVKYRFFKKTFQRNGAEYSVFVNTGQEFDGSDSGARPDEAVSWGKIKRTATPVKVYCDATLVFPLLVSQTFAKQIYPKNLDSVSLSVSKNEENK